jgi:TP901 family phage tail tape measure protein
VAVSGAIEVLVEPDTKDFPRKLESGLKSTSGVAGKVGKGIGLALAAGTIAAGAGFGALIDLGNEYQANLNELESVSQATGLQMERIGTVAKQLGSDMSLPATSAADAAKAMVELAKGGLTVDEAMQAAKGTLQLAAAAQIDGATAAEIQSSALNAFGLSADQAGKVADVLANTANAAAGSMVDIGNSLKYVAPVAAALKVPIEDTASAIGLLANQGVKGEQAGTSLRGILASLSSPSVAAAAALKVLGVQAFDTQGKFIGLRAFTDQLAKAKGKLTDAEFAAAASTAFGNEGLTAANALAAEGATGFDEMAQAVSRSGGAADVAAAQTKGLGGAIEGFKSQVETAGIGIYEVLAPSLERGVRAAASFVERFTPKVVGALESVVAAGELFGPALADRISARGAVVGDAVEDVLAPIARSILPLLNSAVNTGIELWGDFTDVLGDAVDGARPVAAGIAAIVQSAVEADGPVSAVGAGIGLLGDAAAGAGNVLGPLGGVVGALASGFASLPGPIQSAVIGLGLLAAFRGKLTSVGDALNTKFIDPLRRVGDEVRLQKALYDGTAGSVGTLGAAFASLESRVSVVGAAMTAVRTAGGAYSTTFSTITQATDRLALSTGIAVESIGRIPSAVVSAGQSVVGFGSNIASMASSARIGLSLAADQVRATVGNVVNSVRAIPTAVGVAALSMQDRLVGAARSVGDAFTALPGKIALLPTAIGVGVINTLERVPVAVAGSVSALGRFSGAVAGAAVAAGSLAKSAATGLIGALGGPFGIAIAGASVGLSMLADNNAKAAAAEKAHQAAVSSLADALRNAKGDIEEVARTRLADTFTKDMSEAGDAARMFGIDLSDVVDTARRGAPVNEQFAAKLRELDQVARDSGPMDSRGKAALTLLGAIGQLNNQYDGATEANKRYDEILRSGGQSMLDTTASGKTLSGAMEVLRDTTASADDRARALKDALDALSGGQVSLEASQARLNEQLDRLSEAFGENVDKSKGWGASLLNVDGSINTATANGRKLFDGLRDLSGGMAEVAQKTFDVARAQGDDIPAALGKAVASADAVRQGFLAQADQLGLTADQVSALADRYDLVPSLVATLIETPGMTKAQAELVLVRALVNQVPGDKPIVVRSLSDEARQKLIDLGFVVTTLPNGQVQVSANTAPARDGLDGLIADISRRRGTLTVDLVYVDKGPSRSTRGGLTMHDGGVVSAYASGGVHRFSPMAAGVAKIVPPNSWRLIGDRLDVDEFYLPDNSAAQTMAIAAEWARRRGLELVDAFAAGTSSRSTSVGTSSGSGRGDVHVDQLILQTLNDRPRLRDVQEELYYQGVY